MPTLPEFIWPALFGAALSFILTKITAKTARLRYSTTVERVALSTNDPVFGAVRVTWGKGNAVVRNLFFVTIEIENSNARDFEDVFFKVYCANDTNLLTEKTSVAGTPYVVNWSPSYAATLQVPQNGTLTDAQWAMYYHSREYKQALFNRGQRLHLAYLCTRPNDDTVPSVFVDMQLKGARLTHQARRNLVLGVPVQTAIAYGLVIAVCIAVLCIYFLHRIWIASAICLVTGMFAQILGTGAFKLQRWLWKQLAG